MKKGVSYSLANDEDIVQDGDVVIWVGTPLDRYKGKKVRECKDVRILRQVATREGLEHDNVDE